MRDSLLVLFLHDPAESVDLRVRRAAGERIETLEKMFKEWKKCPGTGWIDDVFRSGLDGR